MRIKTVLKIVDVKTLFASLLPVLFGSAYSLYAFGKSDPILMVVMAVALMLVQAATNIFNDYQDFTRGTDAGDRSDEKVLVSGELTAVQLLAVMTVFTVTAVIIGIVIASMTSWWILIVTAAGLAAAFLYSSGPNPISYTPFGELTAGSIMGVGITSTVICIQAGGFYWQSIPAALPTVVYIAYIMFTNNLSDREKDLGAGRRTLPGMLDFETGKKIWMLCSFLLPAVTITLILLGIFPVLTGISSILILNYRSIYRMRNYRQDQLQKDRMMGIIGMLGMQYHVLMIIGLLGSSFLKI